MPTPPLPVRERSSEARGRAECAVVYEIAPGAASRPLASPPAPYRPREPDKTLLHQVVARELEDLDRWLAESSPYGHGLPRSVRRQLEGFLECGQLERGFSRVLCKDCRFEHFVAFSCKTRGICPSCGARRMNDTAARDRILLPRMDETHSPDG
jgi:ribosomal protein S27E